MIYLALFAIAFGISYTGFHMGAGHTHYSHARAAGLSPNLYWSLARGPWVSVRVPGTGFRVGHKL